MQVECLRALLQPIGSVHVSIWLEETIQLHKGNSSVVDILVPEKI